VEIESAIYGLGQSCPNPTQLPPYSLLVIFSTAKAFTPLYKEANLVNNFSLHLIAINFIDIDNETAVLSYIDLGHRTLGSLNDIL